MVGIGAERFTPEVEAETILYKSTSGGSVIKEENICVEILKIMRGVFFFKRKRYGELLLQSIIHLFLLSLRKRGEL